MVVDQRLFRAGDGFFDGLELLGNIKAGTSILNHRDDGVKMAIGAFQPFDDTGMGRMSVFTRH